MVQGRGKRAPKRAREQAEQPLTLRTMTPPAPPPAPRYVPLRGYERTHMISACGAHVLSKRTGKRLRAARGGRVLLYDYDGCARWWRMSELRAIASAAAAAAAAAPPAAAAAVAVGAGAAAAAGPVAPVAAEPPTPRPPRASGSAGRRARAALTRWASRLAYAGALGVTIAAALQHAADVRAGIAAALAGADVGAPTGAEGAEGGAAWCAPRAPPGWNWSSAEPVFVPRLF